MKPANVKTLERYLQNKEYFKVLQAIGKQYETTTEHFFLVEAYIGLGQFDKAEKMLINWQTNLLNAEEWANWCYLYAKSLHGMKNKIDALTTLNFANDFLKSIDDDALKYKVEVLKQVISQDY